MKIRVDEHAALVSFFEQRAAEPPPMESDLLRMHLLCETSKKLTKALSVACDRQYGDERPIEAPRWLLAPLL